MAQSNTFSSFGIPNQQEITAALCSYKALKDQYDLNSGFTIRQKDQSEITIPIAAARLLMAILGQMAEGHAVGVTTLDEELTTQEAADFLNVSRPYLVSLLEKQQIPHRKVGTKRRVLVQDLIAFKEKIFEQRSKTLEALAKQAQDLNMGY